MVMNRSKALKAIYRRIEFLNARIKMVDNSFDKGELEALIWLLSELQRLRDERKKDTK